MGSAEFFIMGNIILELRFSFSFISFTLMSLHKFMTKLVFFLAGFFWSCSLRCYKKYKNKSQLYLASCVFPIDGFCTELLCYDMHALNLSI